MIKDWHVEGEVGGYGNWAIEQKSSSEFETVASHSENFKYISIDL